MPRSVPTYTYEAILQWPLVLSTNKARRVVFGWLDTSSFIYDPHFHHIVFSSQVLDETAGKTKLANGAAVNEFRVWNIAGWRHLIKITG